MNYESLNRYIGNISFSILNNKATSSYEKGIELNFKFNKITNIGICFQNAKNSYRKTL